MANKRLNAVITIGGALSSSLKSALGSAKSRMLEIGSAIDSVKNRQRELNRVIAEQEKLGRAGSAQKVAYAQQELAAIDKKLAKLRQVQAAEARIGAAQRANTAQRGVIQSKLGSTMATGAIAMLPIGAAIKSATEFDYKMQLIGNTANMTRAEILALGQVIMQASKDSNQSAENTQKALGFLIAAGMDVATAQKMIGTIGKAATATGGDIEDLSRAAFTLVDSLKIQPGKALTDALDTLAVAGKEGNVELKDMAKVLPVLGSGMVALKMQGREAAATMGAALEVARKGAADADEAANNMKNYIAKIMSPETLKKAKKNFNLDLYKIIKDAQSSGKNPFDESMMAIMKATKGDQKAIGELFSDMQVQNFLRPMMQNWDEYQKIKQKALNGDGTIDGDFIKMMETTKEQMAAVGIAVQKLAIAVGGAITAAFGGKSSLAEKIDGVTNFVNANRELVGTVFKVVGSLVVARVAFLGVSLAVNVARGAWLAGQAVFLAAPGIFTAVGTALRFVGTSLLWVGRAMLLNPIGLAVTAIGVAAFVIYKYWTPITAFFRNLWQGVKTEFAAVYDWIVGKVSTIMGLVGKVGAAAQKVGEFLGVGGAGVGAQQYDAMGNATGAAALPAPTMATSRGASGNWTDNSTTTMQITQQPGQDARELAREITRMQEQSRQQRARGSLYDKAD